MRLIYMPDSDDASGMIIWKLTTGITKMFTEGRMSLNFSVSFDRRKRILSDETFNQDLVRKCRWVLNNQFVKCMDSRRVWGRGVFEIVKEGDKLSTLGQQKQNLQKTHNI